MKDPEFNIARRSIKKKKRIFFCALLMIIAIYNVEKFL